MKKESGNCKKGVSKSFFPEKKKKKKLNNSCFKYIISEPKNVLKCEIEML